MFCVSGGNYFLIDSLKKIFLQENSHSSSVSPSKSLMNLQQVGVLLTSNVSIFLFEILFVKDIKQYEDALERLHFQRDLSTFVFLSSSNIITSCTFWAKFLLKPQGHPPSSVLPSKICRIVK